MTHSDMVDYGFDYDYAETINSGEAFEWWNDYEDTADDDDPDDCFTD